MRLLITGAFKYTDEQIEYFKSVGFDVTFVQDERVKLDIDVSGFDAVICNSLFVNNDIKDFESLKYIQALSAGLDRLPLNYIQQKGIALFNARGVYSIPMAEFALCGILELYKQSGFYFENQKAHKWNKHRGLLELYGKEALIVGAGSIGTEIAKRLSAFGVTVYGIDISPYYCESYEEMYPLDLLDERLESADIVALSTPLTEKTKGLFDASKFRMMKDTAVLVNLSRGAVVNENDLVTALEEKTIGGAVLDVFETEPLSEASPLWDMQNVILTPHTSFIGENNNERMFEVIKKNMERYLNE